MTRLIIFALALVALPFVVSTGALAQSGPDEPATAAVEVTVWQRVSNPSLLYVSTRPEEGAWRTLNTALDMSMLSSSERFHQSNAVRVEVPLGDGATAAVEVTVWRRVSNPSLLYVSTRPEGGAWRTLNTALDMSMPSSSGRFHQSNAVLVEVPLGESGSDRAQPASDRDVLVALYRSTGGASWDDNTNWLSDRPIGEWHGVTTNSDGRVIELELPGNSLRGAIPPDLGNLTSLSRLSLGSYWDDGNQNFIGNELTGEIPPELGRLSNLTFLSLSGNQLTGEIPPELGKLSNLWDLFLGVNQLTGEIPPELGGLSNLRALWLSDNQLMGEIPAELGGLSNLRNLWLGANQLMGEIPAELGGLSNLWDLFLYNNQLTGEIPPELGGLSNLTRLWLYNNELTGGIPPELGRLSNLTRLELYGNQLTGEIPAELGGLSNLTTLKLHHNQLTGEIPAELGGLSNLTTLSLHVNQLTGEIPAELGGLSNLTQLVLSRNQLTGCIPEGLRDTSNNDLGLLNLPDCGASTPGATATPTPSPERADGECHVGLIVEPGESCTYPGTSTQFSVDSSGTGRFLFFAAGAGIDARNTTINGVTYNFKASKQSDRTWLIEAAGG